MYIFNQKTTIPKILNLLIAAYPVLFILGNLTININTILIILLGCFYFKKKIFEQTKNVFLFCLVFFFIFLIFSTIINNIYLLSDKNILSNHVIKSILFLRYLFLFLIISTMAKNNFLNLKYLFYSAAFISVFLGIDIIIQLIFGRDIFGYPHPFPDKDAIKLSGFFGTEIIAGGYLQRFSLFAIFFFAVFNRNIPKKKLFIILFSNLLFFFICIILTGNRMPLLLFILSFFIYFILEQKVRKLILITFIFISIIFASSLSYEPIRDSISPFYKHSTEIIFNSYGLLSGKNKEDVKSHHLRNFNAGFHTWKKNKIMGGGLRSMRINCKNEEMGGVYNLLCNAHPHNYFLEILIDVGIIGVIFYLLIFLIPIIKFIKIYINSSSVLKYTSRSLLIPPFLLLFNEFFLIRSSGSFFSTGNATIIFLILAIIANTNNIFYKNK